MSCDGKEKSAIISGAGKEPALFCVLRVPDIMDCRIRSNDK
jgi:hypothetical protein